MAQPAASPLGRRQEPVLRQHLRRPVHLLVRVSWKHTAFGYHAVDRSMLHHFDTVSSLEHVWSSGWTSWYWEDRDH